MGQRWVVYYQQHPFFLEVWVASSLPLLSARLLLTKFESSPVRILSLISLPTDRNISAMLMFSLALTSK
jgi:hypothetical protein